MIGFIIYIIISGIDKLIGGSHKLLIAVGAALIRNVYLLISGELLHHFVKLLIVAKPQCVQHKIIDIAILCQNEYTFIILLRPSPCLDIVLILIQPGILRHLIKHIRAHHGGHHAVGVAGGAKAQ